MDLLDAVFARNKETTWINSTSETLPDFWEWLRAKILGEFPTGVVVWRHDFRDLPRFRGADLFGYPALARYVRSFEPRPDTECREYEYRSVTRTYQPDFDLREVDGARECCERFMAFYQASAQAFADVVRTEGSERLKTIQRLALQAEAVRASDASGDWVTINGLRYHFAESAYGLAGVNPKDFPALFPGERPDYNSRFTLANIVVGTEFVDLRHRPTWKSAGRINWVSLSAMAKADKNLLARARNGLKKHEQLSRSPDVQISHDTHGLF